MGEDKMISSIKMIEEFANAFGAPGFEDDVVAVGRKYAPEGAKLVEDNMRNLYICPKNERDENKPVVLIDAHSDEVGAMVHSVKSNGTLSFITIGMWSPAVIMAQKVVIKNSRGEYIEGVVASTPPHFGGVKQDTLAVENMSIDIGATSKEEAIKVFGIGVANPIVPYSQFKYDEARDVIISKAMDCRLGCAAVMDVMHAVKEMPLDVNVVGVLTSQEENGYRGAKVAANMIKPDIAICFEGTPADDTFQVSDMVQTALKKGPMLRHIDVGMITNPRFIRFALDIAREKGIPVQEAVRTGGGTNGAAFHISELGVPTIIIGHPSRHIHSPHSIASFEDYKNGVKLAVEVVKALNKDIIASF
ncbi:MAG: M20/M25/M40 family metallo-hydrolase [Defluviitaleaceae bacterium]|nr:M20/M25/M40 family metallo-hydrolase [Defluviitaleaceae bacterium]